MNVLIKVSILRILKDKNNKNKSAINKCHEKDYINKNI